MKTIVLCKSCFDSEKGKTLIPAPQFGKPQVLEKLGLDDIWRFDSMKCECCHGKFETYCFITVFDSVAEKIQKISN